MKKEKLHDFDKSIKVGQEGEDLIKKYLSRLPRVASVRDVSNNKKYQYQDIDLLVKCTNGETVSVEIKTDTYDSGNIFFETVSNKEHHVPGCMYKSKADLLLYYFTKTRELYTIKLKQYIEWFEKNQKEFDEKEYKKKFKNIDRRKEDCICTYTSEGYAIPKTFLESNFEHYKKEKI